MFSSHAQINILNLNEFTCQLHIRMVKCHAEIRITFFAILWNYTHAEQAARYIPAAIMFWKQNWIEQKLSIE